MEGEDRSEGVMVWRNLEVEGMVEEMEEDMDEGRRGKRGGGGGH